jgi:hypothetical protein
VAAVSRLDDLLSYEDKPRRRPRRPWLVRIIRVESIAVALATVAWVFLQGEGTTAPYVLMLTLFLAGGAMILMLRQLSPSPLPDTMRDTLIPKPPDGIPDSDGAFRAVRRWGSRLDGASADPRRGAHTVQSAIAGLVDERLRLRHAVIRSTDPVRAQALCGRELWTFITVPSTQPVDPNELATVVAQLEAI